MNSTKPRLRTPPLVLAAALFLLASIVLPLAASFVERPITTIPLPPAVQTHVDWILDLLNGVAEFEEGEYQTRFSPTFLSIISSWQFEETIVGLRTAGGEEGDCCWSVPEVLSSSSDDGGAAEMLIQSPSGEMELVLTIGVNDEGTIDTLYVAPAELPVLEDAPESIAGAANRLQEMGNFHYVEADIEGQGADDGQMPNLNVLSGYGYGIDEPMPIGSMFKLYVLGAVVDAVKNGTISWTQTIDIVDDYRSIGSGMVHFDPPGSNRTVLELAELMISISDNTATDHLMALVGRPAVEAAVQSYGHSMPELNVPFANTREFFILKLYGKTDAISAGEFGLEYSMTDPSDVEMRRDILSRIANVSVTSLNMSLWTDPIEIESIEWFASPTDLCNVLAILRNDEEAYRILQLNPGIPDEQGLWSYIGFKGGSEPGVLGMAWYLEADNGIRRCVAGTLWDPVEKIANEIDATLLFGAIRDLSYSEIGDSQGQMPSENRPPSSSDATFEDSRFGTYVMIVILTVVACILV